MPQESALLISRLKSVLRLSFIPPRRYTPNRSASLAIMAFWCASKRDPMREWPDRGFATKSTKAAFAAASHHVLRARDALTTPRAFAPHENCERPPSPLHGMRVAAGGRSAALWTLPSPPPRPRKMGRPPAPCAPRDARNHLRNFLPRAYRRRRARRWMSDALVDGADRNGIALRFAVGDRVRCRIFDNGGGTVVGAGVSTGCRARWWVVELHLGGAHRRPRFTHRTW